ncbi:uncharacterized protein Tco025E_05577 [Trypanosoma conorhini]|uniref:Uncharacterized protein n=1 Tax=Trypanosoma conorhini TaxID=83891 RepID=A0A3R7MHW3_9TRYP|nr:uncharacterized protein Tco025E_05577 [Trypanosoma conorhini]RNF15417.1 hypothetical protein Tco025E_05577 [Trypanosoma conorhini]
MLYARRKKQQQLTGKIGHSNEEYEIGGAQAVVAQHVHGGARRFPQRRPDVNPISWQSVQQQQQQRQREQSPQKYQEALQQREQWLAPHMVPAAPPAKLPPLQGKANYNRNDIFPQPIQFASALPPLNASPVLPGPLVLERSPLRFPALDAAALANAPPFVPYPSTAVPCSEQAPFSPQTPPRLAVSPPLLQGPPSHAVSPQRDYRGDFNSNPAVQIRSSSSNNNDDEQRSCQRLARHPVSPYPQEKDDALVARRRAREQAIEVQKENARLCEERRLQREREKRLEMEEQRQQEELARLERARIGLKEQLDMERERQEANEAKKGRKKSTLVENSSEAQFREDLQRQMYENKKRKAEEAERLAAAEGKDAEQSFSAAQPVVSSSETNPAAAAPSEKKESVLPAGNSVPQSPPVTEPPASSGAAGSVFAPLFPAPPLFSLGPLPFDVGPYEPAVPGFPALAPTLPFPSAAPTAPPAVDAAAAALPSQAPAPAWSVPAPFTPKEPGSAHGAAHYEAKLRDMMANHLDIQRTLESETRRGHGAAALPPLAQLPSPLLQRQLGPLNALPAQNRQMAAGPGVVGDGNGTAPGGLTLGPEVAPTAAPGLGRNPRGPAPRITVLGVSPPSRQLGVGGSGAAAAPYYGGEDLDELSAEPSRFVGGRGERGVEVSPREGKR